MLGSWSTVIDPIQLADKGARLTGSLPLKGLRRLIETCGGNEQGVVNVDLQFERDPSDGLHSIHGRLEARLASICQRCMERLDLVLTSEPRLVLLRPGEREDLLDAADCLIVERALTMGDLIEDELLLEVPMVPLHPAENCGVKLESAPRTPKKKDPARLNPFSVLEKLKREER